MLSTARSIVRAAVNARMLAPSSRSMAMHGVKGFNEHEQVRTVPRKVSHRCACCLPVTPTVQTVSASSYRKLCASVLRSVLRLDQA
jgi:hypothetical protein